MSTIGDVAREAGVSIGTVDRVLHNRAGVSASTRQKVLEAIQHNGFSTNIYASLLSQNRTFQIVAVIPYFQAGEYWSLVYDGLMRAASQAKRLKIEFRIFYYNQFDIASFRDACVNALDIEPSGVIIAPIYKEESEWLASKLNERQLPLVYLDTRSIETEYLAFFGMPMWKSGYLAADLLVDGDHNAKEIVSFTINRSNALQNSSMNERRCGFEVYLKERRPDCTLYHVEMSPSDFLHNIRVFDDFFAVNHTVEHIVTFNSRAYMIADWMELRGVTGKRLIGFDALPKNVAQLQSGRISLLIAERVAVSAMKAVDTLVDYMVLHKKPARQDNYSSMDILNRYNVEFYETI